MLDLVGLVDPPVVAARREGRLAALVRKRDPRYVLVPPQFRPGLLGPLLADPALTDRYRPIDFFTDPDYQGGTVTLYERHPLRFTPAGSSTREGAGGVKPSHGRLAQVSMKRRPPRRTGGRPLGVALRWRW